MPAKAPDPQQLFDSLVSTLTVYGWLAAVVGLVMVAARWLVPAARGPLFPPQRCRAAPWLLPHVILMSILFVGLPQVAMVVLAESGVRRLWAITLAPVVAGPLILGGFHLIFRYAVGALPYQVGFTCRRPVKDLLAGGIVWLVVTPLCLLIQYGLLHTVQPSKHPAEELLAREAGPAAWMVIGVGVLVLAPLVEEILFRGVIQPWFVQEPALADLTMLIAILAWIIRGAGLDTIWPMLLLVTAAPGYIIFERLTRRWLPRPGAARAIFAASLLFAAIHFDVWPTPIPLFFFSLGVGYLAYRTQSLLGPIFVHVFFNLVSFVELATKS